MTEGSGRQQEITELLLELRGGQRGAFDALVPLVYQELRVIARQHLRRREGTMTLDTTALVHDAYLRLVDRTRYDWEDRGHFLAVFSTVMRNLVVDYARARSTAKRGGDRVRVTLDESAATVETHADQILAVDEALDRLRRMDERLVRVVECRYFAGLTEPETAAALAISERTVRRDWTKARLVLHQLVAD
jgi:RNA polymerase sigma factor (TIGR02999 family)